MARRSADNELPRPFLKWVGGKRQIIRSLLQHVPADLAKLTYFEPFVGGGALFFAARPPRAVLSDNNRRLVRTYIGVRDHVDKVISLLGGYPHDRAFFTDMRTWAIDSRSDAEVAAWMIYLNKTAYNGLYRVNSRNEYNVPFGRYSRVTLCDEPNLRACSRLLQGVEMVHDDFEAVVKRAKKGDFVYFDPPYVPLSATSYFTGYTAEGFDSAAQERLRDLALRLKRRHVKVLLSNSGAGFVREIYGNGFKIDEVEASRAVNCRADGRGKITELIIR